jgi:hypothetical protein
MKIAKIAALVVAAVSSSVYAVGPGTYTVTIPASGTASLPLNPGLNGNLNLPQYDGVAPLASIVVTLSGFVTSSGTFTNNDAASINYSIDLVATGKLTKPNAAVTLLTISPSGPGLTGTLGSGVGTNFGPLNGTDSNTATVPFADWAPYLGSGNVTIPYSLTGAAVISGGSNLTSTIVTVGNLTASVTYNVPEPTAMGLLAPAAMVMGRRRRA